METIEKNWILSFDELRVLLFSLGYTQCEGILMPEREFTDRQVLMAMQKMSSREWIENKGNEFVIQDDLKEALEIIGSPQHTAELENKETGAAWYYYRGRNHIVLTERYWPAHDTLRVRMLSPELFQLWRQEAGI